MKFNLLILPLLLAFSCNLYTGELDSTIINSQPQPRPKANLDNLSDTHIPYKCMDGFRNYTLSIYNKINKLSVKWKLVKIQNQTNQLDLELNKEYELKNIKLIKKDGENTSEIKPRCCSLIQHSQNGCPDSRELFQTDLIFPIQCPSTWYKNRKSDHLSKKIVLDIADSDHLKGYSLKTFYLPKEGGNDIFIELQKGETILRLSTSKDSLNVNHETVLSYHDDTGFLRGLTKGLTALLSIVYVPEAVVCCIPAVLANPQVQKSSFDCLEYTCDAFTMCIYCNAAQGIAQI